jgi:hypothetical protein
VAEAAGWVAAVRVEVRVEVTAEATVEVEMVGSGGRSRG